MNTELPHLAKALPGFQLAPQLVSGTSEIHRKPKNPSEMRGQYSEQDRTCLPRLKRCCGPQNIWEMSK